MTLQRAHPPLWGCAGPEGRELMERLLESPLPRSGPKANPGCCQLRPLTSCKHHFCRMESLCPSEMQSCTGSSQLHPAAGLVGGLRPALTLGKTSCFSRLGPGPRLVLGILVGSISRGLCDKNKGLKGWGTGQRQNPREPG